MLLLSEVLRPYVTEVQGSCSAEEGIYDTEVLAVLQRKLTFAALDLWSLTFVSLIIILNQSPAPIPNAEGFTNPSMD